MESKVIVGALRHEETSEFADELRNQINFHCLNPDLVVKPECELEFVKAQVVDDRVEILTDDNGVDNEARDLAYEQLNSELLTCDPQLANDNKCHLQSFLMDVIVNKGKANEHDIMFADKSFVEGQLTRSNGREFANIFGESTKQTCNGKCTYDTKTSWKRTPTHLKNGCKDNPLTVQIDLETICSGADKTYDYVCGRGYKMYENGYINYKSGEWWTDVNNLRI